MAEQAAPAISARQPRAIHSALTVLEAVAERGAGVSAREISAALGMPRATTYRLLNILVEDEYLVRTPDLTGFALGAKVAQLAATVTPAHVPAAARHLLTEARNDLRGGVHLFAFGEGRSSVLDEDPDFPLSDTARLPRDPVGSAISLLLLLAGGAPSADRRRASLELAALGAVRGVAEDGGWSCLAVPIRDERDRIVGCVAFTGPHHRVAQPDPVLALLLPAAARIAPFIV